MPDTLYFYYFWLCYPQLTFTALPISCSFTLLVCAIIFKVYGLAFRHVSVGHSRTRSPYVLVKLSCFIKNMLKNILCICQTIKIYAKQKENMPNFGRKYSKLATLSCLCLTLSMLLDCQNIQHVWEQKVCAKKVRIKYPKNFILD